MKGPAAEVSAAVYFDLFSHLGDIHGHNMGKTSDSNTSQNSTRKVMCYFISGQVIYVSLLRTFLSSSGLQCGSNEEDNVLGHDTSFSAKSVDNGTTDQGSKPCSEQE